MNTINAYTYNIVSYEYCDKKWNKYNVADIFFINMDTYNKTGSIKKSRSCLRLYNFICSFYLCRLPGLTENEFEDFVKNAIGHVSDIKIIFGTDYNGKTLRDSMFYDFGNKMYYAEVCAKASSILQKAYNTLRKACIEYYSNLDPYRLNGFDRLFYDNSETPFRFDMTVLNANNIRYFLSTKYNIPCVGGLTFTFDDKDVDRYDKYSDKNKEWLPGLIINDVNTANNTLLINMVNKNGITFKNFKHNDNINGLSALTLMSYDIETYESSVRILTEEEHIIMCIGVGIFSITNDKPLKRYCISVKDFDNNDIEDQNNLSIERKKDYISKEVKNEYSTLEDDKTTYIIVDNEKDMLLKFIQLIKQYNPTFITGFNNYGFDDRRIWERMKFNNIDSMMLSVLSYYDLSKTQGYKNQRPEMSKFNIKIDGEMYPDNETWTGLTNAVMTDVYKIMLASNAKLYTQQGRGNLDTMLEVNGILNPFNNKQLKKSGLTYTQMWNNWDTNKRIYDILLYCCQDAWITGTLLIKSCQLIDKIEMSTLSCTTISDSVYKAVTWRVKHLIENYAWNNNFAVADFIKGKSETDKETKASVHVSRADNHELGNKQFDVRQIVGGEVKSIAHGRQKYIVALDFSAMYPSQKEGSNIDTSSMVPYDIIRNPKNYGLHESHEPKLINDMYNQRTIYYLSDKDNNEYVIEEFTSEFKNNKNEINKCLDDIYNDVNYRLEGKREELTERLRKLSPTNYQQIITNIYEGKTNKDDILNSIGETEKKYLYTVQSPRDEKTNLVTIHYSLKEKMLSDLRSLRSKVKKQMEAATDQLNKSRYNSKQLAIKVMCNSEYGASNSSYFPYYDTLIGGATTAASRCLIGFLTSILSSDKLFVDKAFIDKNINYLNILSKYGVLTYRETEIKDAEKFVKQYRRYSLRILFDKYYQLVNNKVWIIELKPSRVVYQDTDSNYYTNDYIRGLMVENETPYTINLKMSLLMAHNNLIGCFIENAIYRKPISVGFEGAFIVARYFNVKKKYYGVVWNEKMDGMMPKECYKDGILIDDYSEYWKPAKTTYPLPNGDYIKINIDDLIHSNKDKLKMIKSQNIKCTGVDLARRDQYKFINANHIKIIQNDLHFLKYKGNNNWVDISNTNMLDIVTNLLIEFKEQFNQICKIVDDMINNKQPTYDYKKFYNLRDFAKDVSFKYVKCDSIYIDSYDDSSQHVIEVENSEKGNKYFVRLEDINEKLYLTRNEDGYYTSIKSDKYKERNTTIQPILNPVFKLKEIGKRDEILITETSYRIVYDDIKWEKDIKTMKTIGQRLRKDVENKQKLLGRKLTDSEFESTFPSAFKRKQYVIILTEDVKIDRKKGKRTEKIDMCDKSFLIKEMHRKYREEYPQDVYNSYKYHSMIDYNDFIDLVIISNLDLIHYVDAFCNSVALYVMEQINELTNDPKITDDTDITIKKKAIANALLIKVFPDRYINNSYKYVEQKRDIIYKNKEIKNKILVIKDVNRILTKDEVKTLNKDLTKDIQLIPTTKGLMEKLSKKQKDFDKLVTNEDIISILKTNNFKWIVQRLNWLLHKLPKDKSYLENKVLYYMEGYTPYISGECDVSYQTLKTIPDDGRDIFDKYLKIGTAPKTKEFNKDFEQYKRRVKHITKLLTFMKTIKKIVIDYNNSKKNNKC